MASKRLSGVYGIQNKINSNMYIGSSIDIHSRWRQHLHRLRTGGHVTPHLRAAWAKYGEDQFDFFVIELCEPEKRVALEQYWINKLEPVYNATKSADSPLFHLSPETIARRKVNSAAAQKKAGDKRRIPCSTEKKEKIRASKLANPYQYTPEQKAIMVAAAVKGRKGAKLTPEHRAKIGAANSVALRGKKHSPETRQKMRDAQLTRWAVRKAA
jgi:group I intron endonuclease